jgi:hypothetical protein
MSDMTVFGVCVMAIQILWVVSAILFIIQGFRVHWGWGLANIFLFPLAGIAFFVNHRPRAKIPFVLWAIGFALLLVLLVSAYV